MNGVWTSLTKFERDKIAPGTAFRNALGVAIPLAIGHAAGSVGSGLVGVTGALNVSFQDGRDPYRSRGARMVAASVLCGCSVFVGALCGGNDPIAVGITMLWAFLAGLMVALDQAAADIGTISLVTLVVYGAHSLPPDQAFYSGLAATAGGLLQTLLSVAMWPLRRFEPEQRAMAQVYSGLGSIALAPPESTIAPPGTVQMNEAHKTLSSLLLQRNTHAERLMLLLSESERIRLAVLLLRRLRVRLGREPEAQTVGREINEFLTVVGSGLQAIGNALNSRSAPQTDFAQISRLSQLADQIRKHCENNGCSAGIRQLLGEVQHQTDALAGQIRAAVDLAVASTPTGRVEFERRERRKPLYLRVISAIPILRANLTLDSAACRHGIRLCACVTIAEAFARITQIERGYWVPMTAAIVLKPDFTSTFSRGLLRLAGTFAGLLLATGLFRVFPEAFTTEFVLIVLFMFLLRFIGSANYGVLVTLLSGLVVALFAVAGVPPHTTVVARAIATVIGGVLALVAYIVWPTWERHRLPHVFATMLDSYRDYFQILTGALTEPDRNFAPELDRTRYAGRLARTNVEASFERFTSEPRVDEHMARTWGSAVASSHRMIRAVMALEAVMTHSDPVPARREFQRFAHAVEITLHSLAGALRGSTLTRQDLPDLREAHHALIQSGNAFAERYVLVNIETDRITNTLNTLAVQIIQLLQSPEIPERDAVAELD